MKPSTRTYLQGRYDRSKVYQENRGETFALSFDEYLSLWREDQIKKIERYLANNLYKSAIGIVLTRKNKDKPFELGNACVVGAEHSKKLGRIKKGEKHTQATRDKLKKPKSETTRAKMSQGRKGKGREAKSSESNSKRAEAMRTFWAKKKAMTSDHLYRP